VPVTLGVWPGADNESTVLRKASHGWVGAHFERRRAYGQFAWHGSVPRIDLLVRSVSPARRQRLLAARHLAGLPRFPRAKSSRTEGGVGVFGLHKGALIDGESGMTRQGTGRRLADSESGASVRVAQQRLPAER
jgi:hypothetical protein